MLTLGKHSYGNPIIIGREAKCVVGKYCSIADQVVIFVGAEHNHGRCTTYPFNPLWDSCIDGHPTTKGGVNIGNDVWIGFGATILSGVTIGDGAVIGAKSVVASDVMSYSVVAGNTARHRKFRFGIMDVSKLHQIKWWEWDDNHIKDAIPYLLSNNVDGLYEYWENHVKNGG